MTCVSAGVCRCAGSRSGSGSGCTVEFGGIDAWVSTAAHLIYTEDKTKLLCAVVPLDVIWSFPWGSLSHSQRTL